MYRRALELRSPVPEPTADEIVIEGAGIVIMAGPNRCCV
jgi:hypothetical protein